MGEREQRAREKEREEERDRIECGVGFLWGAGERPVTLGLGKLGSATTETYKISAKYKVSYGFRQLY